MFNVKEVLPERAREVVVYIDDKPHQASLLHNDWVFSEKSERELEIKNMADSYIQGLKITAWDYK